VSTALSPTLLRDLYVRMLLTRIVDEYTCKLYTEGSIGFVASCRGHEAAQIGSAACIEVGKDFTLPYYRDLGVVLTIGMTPHEVFRTYLLNRVPQSSQSSLPSIYRPFKGISAGATSILSQTRDVVSDVSEHIPFHHWGYHKHNMVTGPAPVATQMLHAAGIAFASKLRQASVVTIAYCGDGATREADFMEGMRFAAQQKLPVVFICEQACTHMPVDGRYHFSCLASLPLPVDLHHQQVDGTDIVAVYAAVQIAMQHVREGHGPVLLEMHVVRNRADLYLPQMREFIWSGEDLLLGKNDDLSDPLVRCQRHLQAADVWDTEWAQRLVERLSAEVECAWRDVLHDIFRSNL
jgi:2-oxoisovalerate dehydrogenase E1 component alpha subunit